MYKTFIRSILEFSAVVWHSSLSQSNINDIEQIQKSALKAILKDKYKDYNSALSELNLESLYKRRELLCLRFAKKSLKIENFKKLFTLNKKCHYMNKRKQRKYKQNRVYTEHYLKSSIPYVQSLLNSEDRRIKSLLSNESACPSESYLNGSITDDNLNYNK